MSEDQEKRNTKMLLIFLGLLLVPLFAEIYAWVSGLIIGGIASILFGKSIGESVSFITLLISIIFGFLTYRAIYKHFMDDKQTSSKETT